MTRNFVLAVCLTATSAYVGFEISAPPDPPRVRFAAEAPVYRLDDPEPREDSATEVEHERMVDDTGPARVAAR